MTTRRRFLTLFGLGGLAGVVAARVGAAPLIKAVQSEAMTLDIAGVYGAASIPAIGAATTFGTISQTQMQVWSRSVWKQLEAASLDKFSCANMATRQLKGYKPAYVAFQPRYAR